LQFFAGLPSDKGLLTTAQTLAASINGLLPVTLAAAEGDQYFISI